MTTSMWTVRQAVDGTYTVNLKADLTIYGMNDPAVAAERIRQSVCVGLSMDCPDLFTATEDEQMMLALDHPEKYPSQVDWALRRAGEGL